MTDLRRRFISHLRSMHLTGGGRYAAAVSGGIDSAVLLDLAFRASEKLGYVLEVVHVHHHVRGEDADGDAAFTAQLAAARGLRFHRLDVNLDSRRRSETGLRELRLSALSGLVDAQSLCGCLLGHTASDQAETVAMRVADGAGPGGLAGMAAQRDCFLRPLLPFTRQEIEAYARRTGLTWRHDRMNDDIRHRRVRVRRDLLPAWSMVEGFDVTRGLLRTARQCGEAYAALRALLPTASLYADSDNDCEGQGGVIDCAVLLALPDAARGFAVAFLLHERWPGPPPREVQVQRVLQLVESQRAATEAPLGQGRRAVRNGRWLRLEASPLLADDSSAVAWEPLNLPEGGVIDLPGGRLVLTPSDTHYGVYENEGAGGKWLRRSLDMAALPDVLSVRPRREGDAVVPAGHSAARKLKKLFIDRKIPVGLRGLLPVLCCGEEILWAPGLADSGCYCDGTAAVWYRPLPDLGRWLLPYCRSRT